MLCPNCERETSDDAVLCAHCRHRLQEVAPDVELVRVPVTILFCDLIGFTKRAEEMDPEEVREFQDRWSGPARAELRRHGGIPDKFIGDAVFGHFGALQSHEDDPERAVRAALAISDAFARLNEKDPELDLRFRIGITTGEAVVNRKAEPESGEIVVSGDVVNSGNRLEQAAPVNSILVDEATSRATRHEVSYRKHGVVTAKGKKEGIEAWKVIRARSRSGPEPSRPTQTAFVNRERELGRLFELLHSVTSERTSRFALVLGPAGIGKSRLISEFRRGAERDDGVVWRSGRSLAYGGGAYWALAECVREQAGVRVGDGGEVVAQKLHRAVASLTVSAEAQEWIERNLRVLLGLERREVSSSEEQRDAYAAWRRFFEELARGGPLVLLFEDLHWAESSLLEFIEELLEWSRDVPLLIVGTSRDESNRSKLVNHPATVTIPLDRLAQDDFRGLVSQLVGQRPLSRRLAQTLESRTEGNPLYAEEYVRVLVERGLFELPDRRARKELASVAQPESLKGLIGARLDSLGAREKAVLMDASVIGRVFWRGTLEATAGHVTAELNDAVVALEANQLVRRVTPSAMEDEDEFTFHHDLVREAAYDRIPRRERAAKHRRVAEWIESLGHDRVLDRAELVANHYRRAYELALEAKLDEVPALMARVHESSVRAGEKALSLHAYPAALDFLRSASETKPEDKPLEPELLLHLGQASLFVENSGDEHLAEARDGFLARGLRAKAAEAESLRCELAYQRRDIESMVRHSERAADLLKGLEPSHSMAEVLLDYAASLFAANESGKAIAVTDQLLEIERVLQAPGVRAHALQTRGICRWMLGDLGGRSDLERSVAIGEEIEWYLTSLSYGNLADLHAEYGDLEHSFELFERGNVHAERFGNALHVRWFEAEHASGCYWRGQWDEALRGIGHFLAESKAGTPHFMDGRCHEIRARIALARGDSSEAIAEAERALQPDGPGHDEDQEVQWVFPAKALLARCFLAAGDRGAAEAVVEELLATRGSSPSGTPASYWVVDLAHALIELEQETWFLEASKAWQPTTKWLNAARALCASDFLQAARLLEDIGSVPDAALAKFYAAASARPDDAEGLLASASDFWNRVDAGAHLAGTSELQRRLKSL